MVYFIRKSYEPVGENCVIDDEFLSENVKFYADLSSIDKLRFQDSMHNFFKLTKITGVGTSVDDQIKMLVAAGAVIPMFNFPNWHYKNLKEVLVYADTFNMQFETKGSNQREIYGMVGEGFMSGKMILSKPSILHSFNNETDKENTVIHEFVHLIDMADGVANGVPEFLLNKQYLLPWLDMIHKEMLRIKSGSSDIDAYGYTNKVEFFAVVSEYFFERPDLLKKKHPKLFEVLNEMFDGD